MTRVVHKGDLGKNKDLLEDEAKYDEMLKIRLVNGLFRTSDNILRNILVRDDNVLIPIDENDILGKRLAIFNATEPIKHSKYWSAQRLMAIVKSLELGKHKNAILNDLRGYGLDDKYQMLADRIDNYEEIVKMEIC